MLPACWVGASFGGAEGAGDERVKWINLYILHIHTYIVYNISYVYINIKICADFRVKPIVRMLAILTPWDLIHYP